MLDLGVFFLHWGFIVGCSSHCEARQAQYQEYVWALSDDLNFTQSAHAVVVLKQTGKVCHTCVFAQAGGASVLASPRRWIGAVHARRLTSLQWVDKRFSSLQEPHAHLGWVSGPRASQNAKTGV